MKLNKTKTAPGQGRRWRDKDGNYCFRLRVGTRDEQREINVKRKTHAEREEEVARKLKVLKDQGTNPKAEVTVKARMSEFLETRIKPNRTPSTYRSYKQMVDLYIIPSIGSVKLSKLTSLHAQKVIAFVQAKELSGRTAQYAIAVLCAGVGKRVAGTLKEDLIVPSGSKPRDRVLSLDEISEILEELYRSHPMITKDGELHDYRDRFLIHFILNTGLRINEALGSLVVAVRLRDEPAISVYTQLEWSKDAKGKPVWNLTEPKTDESRRIVPLNDVGVEIVKQQLAMIADDREKAGKGYEDRGLLFPTESGNAMRDRNVRRSLDRAVERVNARRKAERRTEIESVHLHDLRRSYLTHLADVEERLHLVAAIAGHTNVQTTKKHYVWAQEARKREAAGKISFSRKHA